MRSYLVSLNKNYVSIVLEEFQGGELVGFIGFINPKNE
jgi:hypothetical protein